MNFIFRATAPRTTSCDQTAFLKRRAIVGRIRTTTRTKRKCSCRCRRKTSEKSAKNPTDFNKKLVAYFLGFSFRATSDPIDDFSGSQPCDFDDVDCADNTGLPTEGSGREATNSDESSSSSDFIFKNTPTREDAPTPEMIPAPRRTTPSPPFPPDSSNVVTQSEDEHADDSMTSSVGAAASSPSSFSLNLILLVSISLGILVLVFILIYAVYKYRKRDEGVYKIDNTKNVRYESVNTKAPSSDSNGVAASKGATNGSKSSKKKGPVKEWYV